MGSRGGWGGAGLARVQRQLPCQLLLLLRSAQTCLPEQNALHRILSAESRSAYVSRLKCLQLDICTTHLANACLDAGVEQHKRTGWQDMSSICMIRPSYGLPRKKPEQLSRQSATQHDDVLAFHARCKATMPGGISMTMHCSGQRLTCCFRSWVLVGRSEVSKWKGP